MNYRGAVTYIGDKEFFDGLRDIGVTVPKDGPYDMMAANVILTKEQYAHVCKITDKAETEWTRSRELIADANSINSSV